MSRVQSLLCFTTLFATVTFFNVASAHVKIKPALPQIGDPTTVNDVESYTVKVVSTFVADLEKECPKTEKFKVFFEKLNAYSKYVCPVSKAKDNESDMKAKAGSLFQAIADLGSAKNGSKGGTGNKSLQQEKTEAMDTVKMLQSIGGKIAGGENNKTETVKLTVEQQKEIKDGILKWLQVITRIAKKTEEISLKYSSKTQTKREIKEETSSTQTQTKTSSRATRAGNNDDISKSARNSAKESDNDDKNKKEDSKKKNGGKGGSDQGSSKDSTSGDEKKEESKKKNGGKGGSDQGSSKDSTSGDDKKEESKKKNGGKGGSDQGSTKDSTSGDEGSTKSKGDAKEKGSSKNKGEKSEKADKKNHHISYGKIEPNKLDAEQSRNKKEERLRAEMADELD